MLSNSKSLLCIQIIVMQMGEVNINFHRLLQFKTHLVKRPINSNTIPDH